MPYPSQVDPKQIVALARTMIEAEGAEALSLHKLAATLGIKAPSLYRHVGNKQELLRAVNEGTVEQLLTALRSDLAVQTELSPQDQLLAIWQVYRDFAHAHPQSYLLLFTALPGDTRPDEAWLVEMVLPLQRLMTQFVGETDSLTALRGAWAIAHGFIMLELYQQMQRGGDLAATYRMTMEIYLRGLTASTSTVS